MPGMVSFCVAASYVALPVEMFVTPSLSPTEAVCTVPGVEPTWPIDCARDKYTQALLMCSPHAALKAISACIVCPHASWNSMGEELIKQRLSWKQLLAHTSAQAHMLSLLLPMPQGASAVKCPQKKLPSDDGAGAVSLTCTVIVSPLTGPTPRTEISSMTGQLHVSFPLPQEAP